MTVFTVQCRQYSRMKYFYELVKVFDSREKAEMCRDGLTADLKPWERDDISYEVIEKVVE